MGGYPICPFLGALGMQGLKVRLGTAMSLAFAYPDWVEKRLSEVRTPFLVLHGAMDKVTDPKMSQRLFDEARSEDKKIRMYEGAYHAEMFGCMPGNCERVGEFSAEQVAVTQSVLRDIADWLAARS
eukprot:gnl/TRDRNA2_/TRDRNA2_89770_c0_seq3.p1 gnl/TRDRNA2_/TRDRNA2_89770_c0~~gnl/TRDRNA2_/TRDRNA2_89770_c0_seq3.p1  ORF type:complete len:126 (-),score=7.94 gnl/TRDRNA2_/TRDRNA2_89770_c0_seq3:58-435(-)